MAPKDFAVFILTHGRPDNVITVKTLQGCGYTGPIYFIVDNEDKTVDQYIKNFGADRVKVFDKKAMADLVDEGNNFDERRTITHARNACFPIAKEIGVTYFVQLDDDYTQFKFRLEKEIGNKWLIKNLDAVFCSFLEYYKSIPAKSIALSQGGDHIGGFSVTKLKRKAMNSFFCSTERPFQFVGAMNEDVNTYTTLGSRGDLFFTFTSLQLDQKETQSQTGGITDMYLRYGTYCKAFTTVMMHPSGVKASMMQTKNSRIHHSISWKNTTPMILDPKHKKNGHV
jgi:hypothetical protein